jgi:DNA mismatch repair protein MutS
MSKTSLPYTPMMMQYLGIKEKYPDTLIFFRLGDFYELFFDDAKIASKELSLVLTGKNAGQDDKVPMCGVPHHASKNYIAKLIDKGYRVGIVEQLEEATPGKGLVDRDVVQIYSPGAYIDSSSSDHNYIASIGTSLLDAHVIFIDVTTGDTMIEHLEPNVMAIDSVLHQRGVKEIVVSSTFLNQFSELSSHSRLINVQDELNQVEIPLSVFDEEKETYQRLLSYLLFTQKRPLTHLLQPQRIRKDITMSLDDFSLKNLEVTQNLSHHEKYGSLFWLLDETQTPMGSRLLKERVEHPSYDLATIDYRLSIVESMMQHFMVSESLQQLLKEVYDIPRLITRIHFQSANARDLLSLKHSLKQIPSIKQLLSQLKLLSLDTLINRLPTLDKVASLLESAIEEEPPVSIHEGGMIKKGYDSDIDRLRALTEGGQEHLLTLETNERVRTGIKNLKVGYNKVFGYYIEVSNGQLSSIKQEFGYERRQTLTNGERFITKELKALESSLLSAEEQRVRLEHTLFISILEELKSYTSSLQTLSASLSEIDVYLAFATVSSRYQYVKPSFNRNQEIELIESRHPVIEKVMKASRFVSNDFYLKDHERIAVITGPNMGGKSTFMRQVALTVILAQIGCFVPAKKANLPLFDAIYTRIGASDDLVGGQSTFMMEMVQTNMAIQHATKHSLLIFDEIGRGTATFDGMALAHAILEYVMNHNQSLMLFSTHYHELTHLASLYPSIVNMHASVLEKDDQITFLYKLKRGMMSQSYGIHVAHLAKLPLPLLQRAKVILHQLEQKEKPVIQQEGVKENVVVSAVEMKVKSLDLNQVTPIEALQILDALKRSIK